MRSAVLAAGSQAHLLRACAPLVEQLPANTLLIILPPAHSASRRRFERLAAGVTGSGRRVVTLTMEVPRPEAPGGAARGIQH